MSSHKVKGQKVDLATFVGPNMASLPTAPDSTRSEGRDDGRDGRRDRGFGGDRDRGFGSDRGARGDRDNRREFESSAGDRDNNWRKSGGDRGSDRDWGRGAPRESDRSGGYVPLNLSSSRTGGGQPAGRASAVPKGDLDGWSEPVRNSRGGQYEDRMRGGDRGQERDRDRSSGYTNRFSSGDARRSGRSEEVDDPRFANKFSSSTNLTSGAKKDTASVSPFPSLSESVFRAQPQNPASHGKSSVAKAGKKSTENLEAIKATRAAERAESEKVAREAKEAAAAIKAAEKAVKEEQEAAILASAEAAIAGTEKGTALLKSVQSLSPQPSGSSLLAAVMRKVPINEMISPSATSCWRKGEFGDLLVSTLFEKSLEEQIAGLFAVQQFCADKKFPIVEVDGVKKRLIEIIFGALFRCQIVDVDAILGWADSEDDSVPGRLDAIVQTTSFVQALREAGMETYDDEGEEDEEIDAPREFIR